MNRHVRAAAAPVSPLIEPFVAVLEWTASDRPDLLPWLLTTTEHSPSGYMLDELAQDWGIERREIRWAAAWAARRLNELEESRRTSVPDGLRAPDLAALFLFTVQRRERTTDFRRRNFLQHLARNLVSALEDARQRRRIASFIGKAEREDLGATRQWIQRFLGEPAAKD